VSAQIVGFAAGYVAVDYAVDSGPAAWFSPDGHRWKETVLSQSLVCDGEDRGNDSFPTGDLVTNGVQVLLLGGALGCQSSDASGVGAGQVTWITSDGRSWQKSEVFGYPSAVLDGGWAVPAGWEVATSAWNRAPSVWRSSDGIIWTEAAVFNEAEPGAGAKAAAADGTRVISTVENDQGVLRVSGDGSEWHYLSDQPLLGYVSTIFAPTASSPLWLVGFEDPPDSSAWTSGDLSGWTRLPLPSGRFVTAIAPTSGGYVISAERFGADAEDCTDCPSFERQYITTGDGTWRRLEPAFKEGMIFANGPAGLLGFDIEGKVWRLTH